MKPLAERLRPQTIIEMVGQQHLIGKGKVLSGMVENKVLHSMILWGPPGVGKTTLAQCLANSLDAPFFILSAINSGVKELREVIQQAESLPKAILFIDEIHRFSKSQQDALLGAVEKGVVTLIGATTENPSFEVIAALLSRCQVYTLKALQEDELKTLISRALEEDQWVQSRQVKVEETEALIHFSGGDARKLLNLFELVVNSLPSASIVTNEAVKEVLQTKTMLYDKSGEMHYDIISAFIKSIRGSDPNAGVYWLARLLAGGEDLNFIARRLVILASEDIGNANPTALVMATTAMQAVQMVGHPESRIILSQVVTYLASSPKSNASYEAINAAQALVQTTGDAPVPLHLRNAPTRLMKNMGYGKEYKYAHAYPGNFVPQEYMPDALQQKVLYTPGNSAREQELRTYLKSRWKDKYSY